MAQHSIHAGWVLACDEALELLLHTLQHLLVCGCQVEGEEQKHLQDRATPNTADSITPFQAADKCPDWAYETQGSGCL